MTFARKAHLQFRRLAGLRALPEEMTGIFAPDPEDKRDYIKPPLRPQNEPERFSLLDYIGVNVLYQKRTNACSGSATKALELLTARMPSGQITFDPVDCYAGNRIESGYDPLTADRGATVRATMQNLKKRGCIEYTGKYSYDNVLVEPDPSNDRLRIKDYLRIPVDFDAPDQVKRILCQEHLAVVAGVRTYKSNNALSSGRWLLPPKSESWIGGHLVIIVGYHIDPWDKGLRFDFLNSWGDWWGQRGVGSVPASFLTTTDGAFDLWAFTPKYF